MNDLYFILRCTILVAVVCCVVFIEYSLRRKILVDLTRLDILILNEFIIGRLRSCEDIPAAGQL